MKRYLINVLGLVVVSVFFITDYAMAVDIYTFKKERVDQELKGNRGYLEGKPSAVEPDLRASRKRTLIGVDIELPGVYSEEEAQSEPSPIVCDKELSSPAVAKTVVSSSDGKTTEIIDVSSEGKETSRTIDSYDEFEDEWIK